MSSPKITEQEKQAFRNKATKEIIARKEELFGHMDGFLTGIRSFERKAA